ncbi:MAG: ligase-associated DNA damage response endonuclease PdeM [Alphaproteobacteria bacterium]|nr:ligase-associated DNA damage response endonuclease PdeM [Alphaproteobacteria bacterium]
MQSLSLNAPHDRLLVDCSGALVWPDQNLLVVADLHLEKGSSFARRGSAIPPYDSRAAIERLTEVLRRWSPARVISLGDSFHDPDGSNRLSTADRRSIKDLTSRHDWIWISGNHDPAPPSDLGGTSADEITIGKITFRHLPSSRSERIEIAGHLHPKASVRARGRKVSRPCFVCDRRRVLLPAFGCYAGGLNVLDPAVATLFPDDYRAYLLGKDRIHMVAKHQIEHAAH